MAYTDVRLASVNFTRQDGAATVSITSALTNEAAVKLDAILRELIAEDQPRLAAQEREAQTRAMADVQSYNAQRQDMAKQLARGQALGGISNAKYSGPLY